MLCQTHEGYFRLWEEGRGPGQVWPEAIRTGNPGENSSASGAERVTSVPGGNGSVASVAGPAVSVAPGPGLMQRAVNFGQAVVRHAADGWVELESVEVEARLAICRACASCDVSQMVCRERGCGCYLLVKTKWRSESCPLGKWPQVGTSTPTS